MGAQALQYVAAGLTAGSIYALVALGFSIVFNASKVINFAQGEFVMIGGMARGLGRARPARRCRSPSSPAIVLAATVGLLLEKLTIERARARRRRRR